MPTVTWLRSRWRGSSPPTTARCWRPGFAELAAQLGAPGLADTRDPVASVHAVLAGFATPWLLLFDNAADIASVAVFLPPAEPGRLLRAPTQQNGRSGAARLACQPAGTRRQIGGSASGYQPALRVVGRLAVAVTGQRRSDPPTVYLCIGALGANVRICRISGARFSLMQSSPRPGAASTSTSGSGQRRPQGNHPCRTLLRLPRSS